MASTMPNHAVLEGGAVETGPGPAVRLDLMALRRGAGSRLPRAAPVHGAIWLDSRLSRSVAMPKTWKARKFSVSTSRDA